MSTCKEINKITFFRSYYEGIKALPKNRQLEAYNAIFRYAFDGIVPAELNKTIIPCWENIRPNLDSSLKKYVDGSKGGRPSKTTGFANAETTGYATCKTTGYANAESDKELDKEMDRGKGDARLSRRRLKGPANQVCQSLPESVERVGYAATEDLKKSQIKQLEQAAQQVTAQPPESDQETCQLKEQFRQQINPEAAAPASIPPDTVPAIMEARRENNPEHEQISAK